MKDHIAYMGLLATTLVFFSVTAVEVSHKPLEKSQHLILKVTSYEEMNKILERHPDAVDMAVTRKNEIEGRSTHPQGRSVVTYTLGTGRVSGDRLVSTDSSTNDFKVPTTLTATMTYPSSGTGATISFVKINVYQSNENGRAYVTSGGIGSNRIVVVVEAEKTYYFDYYCYVYGK